MQETSSKDSSPRSMRERSREAEKTRSGERRHKCTVHICSPPKKQTPFKLNQICCFFILKRHIEASPDQRSYFVMVRKPSWSGFKWLLHLIEGTFVIMVRIINTLLKSRLCSWFSFKNKTPTVGLKRGKELCILCLSPLFDPFVQHNLLPVRSITSPGFLLCSSHNTYSH